MPASLGLIAAASAIGLIGVAALVWWAGRGHIRPAQRDLLWVAPCTAAVFLAGLYDDFRPRRTKGMVAQLRLLARGTASPGAVKLVVIAAASAIVAWMTGARDVRFALGLATVAGTANLFNLLDVVPGRALKFFLPAILAVGLAAGDPFLQVLGVPLLPIAAVLLRLDLSERAMLGDSGANVLGFVVGIGLLLSLSTGGLVVAVAAIVLLHVLSETVTLSRLIDAAPPLRWFDRLGRPEKPERGPDSHSEL